MKRLIVTGILALALILSLVGGLRLRRQYEELRQTYQVQVDEAQRELDAASHRASSASTALLASSAERIFRFSSPCASRIPTGVTATG